MIRVIIEYQQHLSYTQDMQEQEFILSDYDLRNYIDDELVALIEPLSKPNFFRILKEILERANGDKRPNIRVFLLTRRFWFLAHRPPSRVSYRQSVLMTELELEKLSSQYKNFSYSKLGVREEVKVFFKFLIRPNKLLSRNNTLRNCVLSSAYYRQLIPEHSKKLPPLSGYLIKIRHSLSYETVRKTLDEIDRQGNLKGCILILSGRFPEQASIRDASIERKTKILIADQGSPKNDRYHLQPFQTHEIEKCQDLLLHVVSNTSEKDLSLATQDAQSWVMKNSSRDHNKFAVWDRTHEEKFDAHKKLIPLNGKRVTSMFNSSLEERFSNLGMDMNGWDNQTEAFSSICDSLIDEQEIIFFRIHPNYINKNIGSLFKLVKFIEDKGLMFAWPWEGVSTPEIVARSSTVVTWASTVALEASVAGKPIINLGKARYDKLMGCNPLGPEMMRYRKDLEKSVNKDKALVALYFTKNFGERFQYSQLLEYTNFERKYRSKIRNWTRAVLIILFRGKNVTPDILRVALSPIMKDKVFFKVLGNILTRTIVFTDIMKRIRVNLTQN